MKRRNWPLGRLDRGAVRGTGAALRVAHPLSEGDEGERRMRELIEQMGAVLDRPVTDEGAGEAAG